MPPRKKSRASSSSSDPSDTDIDRPTILARIVGLNIHFERGFQMSALHTYHSTVTMLSAVGLRSMMTKPLEKANISLVHEFYSGWEIDPDREYSAFSIVRGVRVIFDLSTIRATLDLAEPPTDVLDYFHLASTLQPGTPEYNNMSATLCGRVFTSSFGSGNLKPEYRLLNLFLNFDLKPTTAYSVITPHDILLLFWIATGQRFDIARIIFIWMRSSVENVLDWVRTQSASRTQLIYPYFITRLCHRFHVPVFAEDRLEAGKGLLNDQTVRRSISGRDQSGPSGREPPQHQPATHDPTREEMDTMRSRMDRMQIRMDRMQSQMHRMQRHIHEIHGQMSYSTDTLTYLVRGWQREHGDTDGPPPELHSYITPFQPDDFSGEDEAGPSSAAAADDVDDDISGDEQ